MVLVRTSFPKISSRSLAVLAAAVAVLLASLVGVAAAPPARAGSLSAPKPPAYAAIGDSAAAGPLILPQVAPLSCLRSGVDFAHLVAAQHGLALTDATCSSAKLKNLRTNQADNPPQLDALTRRTAYVTFGPFASNDADIFGKAIDCLVPGCTARQGSQPFADIAALRPRIDRALEAVRRRSPDATVLVIGYGQYLPPGGCPGVQPFTPEDADHVQALHYHLNAVLAASARAHGDPFLDLARLPGAADHTTCAAPGQRWLEGLTPTSLGGLTPFHPTALGMQAWAPAVARGLGL